MAYEMTEEVIKFIATLPLTKVENGIAYYLNREQGVYYPDPEPAGMSMNNYGTIWLKWMESEHPKEYKAMEEEGSLKKKAIEVSEEAMQLEIDIMDRETKKSLANGTYKTSFMERWQQTNQFQMIAREIVFQEVVYHVR